MRKYYAITDAGRLALAEARVKIAELVDEVLGDHDPEPLPEPSADDEQRAPGAMTDLDIDPWARAALECFRTAPCQAVLMVLAGQAPEQCSARLPEGRHYRGPSVGNHVYCRLCTP